MRDFYPFNYKNVRLVDGDEVVIEVSFGGLNTHRHLCGYTTIQTAMIPEAWSKNYKADALQYLNVHGGITYVKRHVGEVVFGFDCNHVDDDERSDLRDPAFVMALAKEMRAQITEYARRYQEWTAADRDRRIEIVQEIREMATPKHIGFGGLIGVLGGAKEFDR